MKQSYKILLYILISFAMIVEIMLLLFCKLSVLDKIYIYCSYGSKFEYCLKISSKYLFKVVSISTQCNLSIYDQI